MAWKHQTASADGCPWVNWKLFREKTWTEIPHFHDSNGRTWWRPRHAVGDRGFSSSCALRSRVSAAPGRSRGRAEGPAGVFRPKAPDCGRLRGGRGPAAQSIRARLLSILHRLAAGNGGAAKLPPPPPKKRGGGETKTLQKRCLRRCPRARPW